MQLQRKNIYDMILLYIIAKRGDMMKNYVENILAPKLQGDGGWVEFVSLENGELTLLFREE